VLRLYDSAISGNCYKVRLLLSQLGRGQDYERVPVDVMRPETRPVEVIRENPAARVPLLVLPDGKAIAESNAILCYLADGSPLFPDDPFDRARVLQWMFFEQNLHEPNIAVVRFWVAFAGREDELIDEIELRRKGGYAALRAMEARLAQSPFFVGGYTIADIALYGYTHVAHEGGFDLAAYPAVRAWLGRVAEQPGYVQMQDPA
jgi:glutathione S-transferase